MITLKTMAKNAGGKWKTVRAVGWVALDAVTKTGKELRLSQVGDGGPDYDDEAVEIYLFTSPEGGTVEANMTIGNSVPDKAVTALIKELLKT